MTTYFGFALADSMFSGACDIRREVLTPEQVKEMAEEGRFTPCLNPSQEPYLYHLS